MADTEKMTAVSNQDGNGDNAGDPNKPGEPSKEPAVKPDGADNGGNGGQPTNAKPIPDMPWWFPAGVAVAVLVYFGWVHLELFYTADKAMLDVKVWQRKWMLFVSLEAIALAAAGAILGVQIQRGRVEAAEKQVDKAQNAAAKANQAAEAATAQTAAHRARAEAYVASLEAAEMSAASAEKREAAELQAARTRSTTARRMLLGQ